jgi:hypothetical protein
VCVSEREREREREREGERRDLPIQPRNRNRVCYWCEKISFIPREVTKIKQSQSQSGRMIGAKTLDPTPFTITALSTTTPSITRFSVTTLSLLVLIATLSIMLC